MGDEKVLTDVREHGWHVVKVFSDADGSPVFAYTVGLTQSFGHPELIIFGLSLEVMHRILNLAGDLIRAGAKWSDGSQSDDILAGYRCAFVAVPRSSYPDYFGYALWFYGGEGFEALQCVWPDKEHQFPWDDGAPSWLREQELVLGKPRVATRERCLTSR